MHGNADDIHKHDIHTYTWIFSKLWISMKKESNDTINQTFASMNEKVLYKLDMEV